MILSLSVHRINSAFLFSVLSKRKKVQLGVQFAPGKVQVQVGQKNSVSFDYDVHDGRWHNLALDIQGHQVFLHTSCGKKSVQADLHSKKEEALDADGSFLLGKMNHNSVAFEGAICQFDIYPSAKAAHNYCDYIKKHCREADTYRPVFPPLLPLFSTDHNITVAPVSPPLIMEITQKTQRHSMARTTVLAPVYHLLMLNKTSLYHTVSTSNPGAMTVSPPIHPGLENPVTFPTQTAPPSFRIGTTLPNQRPSSHDAAGKNSKQGDTDSQQLYIENLDLPAFTKKYEMKPNIQTTPAVAQGSALPHNEQLTTMPSKKPEAKVINVQDVYPTPFIPITLAATDGFQTFDVEPTQFSLLAGAPGLKGEPGLPVSAAHTCPLKPRHKRWVVTHLCVYAAFVCLLGCSQWSVLVFIL